MNDDELLTKYKNYIKKRNMIIIFSLLFIFFIGLMFIVSNYKKTTESNNNQEIKQEEIKQEITKDEEPILTLNTEAISINVNENIDYEKYIDIATDEEDGDLTNKVQFSKIDTSKTGEYEILYFVFDSSNNMSKAILKVTINEEEKKEEPIEDNKETTPKEESKPNQTTPSKENNNSSSKPKPSTKYFLFTDGYTMNNVVDACAKELKEYGGSGTCEPITDENGIYLGMKLEFK